MTLGGLALAVGILVDDATVTIENIERHFEEGYEHRDAIFEGAAQIAVPAMVSTLCICIVFLPMFLLNGVSKYLFVPLAEAVIFAMLASYVLSQTWSQHWPRICSRKRSMVLKRGGTCSRVFSKDLNVASSDSGCPINSC